MTDATLDTTGSKPAVRLERYLPDPPPVVWQAITDRDQLRAWFPCDVIVAGGCWEVWGAITFPLPPGGHRDDAHRHRARGRRAQAALLHLGRRRDPPVRAVPGGRGYPPGA